MINTAREWRCDACDAVEVQTGPRGADVVPTPPFGWTMVDTTRALPPRSEGGVKLGATRNVERRVYCPEHSTEAR